MTARRTTAALLVLGLVIVATIAVRRLAGPREPVELAPPSPTTIGERARDDAALSAAEPLGANASGGELRAADTASPREPAAASAGPAITIALRDPRGAPAKLARWAAFRDDRLLSSGVTASDGAATIALAKPAGEDAAAQDGAFEFAAVHPTLAAIRTTLAPADAELALADGASVAGVIRIDGAPPAEPLLLYLQGSEPFAGASALLPEIRRVLWPSEGPTGASTRTGANGGFRFAGLPRDWGGQLAWSDLELVSPRLEGRGSRAIVTSWLQLDAPREGLVIELASPCVLTGRVVGTDGEGVARASVVAAWNTVTPGLSASSVSHRACDESGAFRVVFPRDVPERVELNVSLPGGGAAQVHGIEPPAGLCAFDAGDLMLPFRLIEVTVRDESGAPIAGAHVEPRPSGDRSAPWRATDGDGRGSFALAEETTRVRAVAEGFSAGDADVVFAANGEATADVVLTRACTLEVRVAPRGCAFGVVIESAVPAFEGEDGPSLQPELEPSSYSKGSGPKPRPYFLARDSDDDRFVLTGLRPGIALSVALVDRVGTRAQERDLAPFAPGERRAIEFDGGEPFGLVGRVFDDRGRPLEDVEVRVGPRNGELLEGAKTDADGRFRFGAMLAERVRIAAVAPGFAPLVLEDEPVGPRELEIVLDRGRDVLVRVVDAAGASADGAWLDFDGLPPRPWDGDPLHVGPAGARLQHATRHAFKVSVRIGGRRFPVAVPADFTEPQTVVTLELPPAGACVVSFSGAVEALGRLERIEVRATGVGPDEPPPYVQTVSVPSGATELRIPFVIPGAYDVRAVRLDAPNRPKPLSEPARVEVVAGREARVDVLVRELSSPVD